MKKVISVALALVMVFGLMAGLQTSAVKNYLIASDETDAKFVPGIGNEVRVEFGNNIFGTWSPNYEETDLIAAGQYKLVTDVKKFGAKAVRLDTSSKASVSANAVIFMDGIKPGTAYIAQYWMKTEGVKLNKGDIGGANAHIWSYDKNGFIDGGIFDGTSVVGTKDWKKYSLKFTVPKKATIDRIIFAISIDDAYGKAWFDGLAVIEGSRVVDDATVDPIKTVAPTPKPTPVPDVPSAWALAEVNAAVAAGIVPTALNSGFKSNITRSDFCDLIIKTIEVKKGMPIADFVATVEGTVEKTFTDTTSANVLAAAKLGIVNGRTETTFAPAAPITRQEATKMLTLAAKVLGADISANPTNFAEDETQIAAWAKSFVAYCVKVGIMKGLSDTKFSPLGRYTREQSMLTALRLFNAIQ